MKKLFFTLLIAAMAPSAFATGFDFRTTGTTTTQVINIRPTNAAAPPVSDVGWGKIFLAGSIGGFTSGNFYISQNGGGWVLLSSFVGTGPISSVFTRIGAITAQTGDYAVAQVTGAAPLASPTFTGVPAAPTAAPGTNTTQIASTAFVAAALGSTVTSVFGRTGAVVKNSGDYLVADVTGAAPLASPTFTGVPAAPTAANGTSTTQLATTAFVGNIFTSTRTISAVWTHSSDLLVNAAVKIGGTAGAGFYEVIDQSSDPSTPANGFRVFSKAGKFSWKGTNGFVRTLDGTANTADRTYTLQDSTGTLALLEAVQTFTANNRFSAKVGIGAAPSTFPLEVLGSGTLLGSNFNANAVLGSGSTGPGLAFGYDGSGGGVIASLGQTAGTNNQISFRAFDGSVTAERAVLTTPSASQPVLTVHGSLNLDGVGSVATNESSIILRAQGANVPTAAGGTIKIYDNASGRFTIAYNQGPNTRTISLYPAALTSNHAYQFADADGTVAFIDLPQTFTQTNKFNANQMFGSTGTPQKTVHVVGPDGQVAAMPTLGAKDVVVIENNGNANFGQIVAAGSIGGFKVYASGGASALGQWNYSTSTNTWSMTSNGTTVANFDSSNAQFAAVNVIPSVDNSKDVGSSSLRFKTVYTGRAVTGAATPTASIPSGFCTSPSVAIDTGSSDLAGILTITTGTGCAAATGSVTLTFSTSNGAYGTNTPACVFTALDGAAAWDDGVTWHETAASTTAVTTKFKNAAVNFTSSTTYKAAFNCTGK